MQSYGALPKCELTKSFEIFVLIGNEVEQRQCAQVADAADQDVVEELDQMESVCDNDAKESIYFIVVVFY